jgi:hypothetical protein
MAVTLDQLVEQVTKRMNANLAREGKPGITELDVRKVFEALAKECTRGLTLRVTR